MAGRMGNDRVTVKALRIVQADAERNLLVVQGSVPGPNGGLVMIRKSAVHDGSCRGARARAKARMRRAQCHPRHVYDMDGQIVREEYLDPMCSARRSTPPCCIRS